MSKTSTNSPQLAPNNPSVQNKNPSIAQIEDPIRLAAIRAALKSLKEKNEHFLQHFELNSYWRKIYNGLLTFNHQQQLTKLVQLKVCESKGVEKSFFDPFSKTPVSICYNKINRYQTFEKQLLFNLVLHYDNKVKSDTNWNLIEPTTRSVIRGLHISGICQKQDKKCFEDQVKLRVLDKERFQGIKIKFDQIYQKAMQDYEPISQIMDNSA